MNATTLDDLISIFARIYDTSDLNASHETFLL